MDAVLAPLPATVSGQIQQQWISLRNVLRKVPLQYARREYVGLAVMLDDLADGLIPNQDVLAVTLVDIPAGHMTLRKPCEFYALTVRPFRQHRGLPHLYGRGDQYDYCRFPGRHDGRVTSPDTLLPEQHPRLFMIAHGLHLAVSAAAVHYSRNYQGHKDEFYAEVLHTEVNLGEKLVPLGEDMFLTAELPAPRTFMPRPFVGVLVPPVCLFEKVVHPYKSEVKRASCPADMVGRFLSAMYDGTAEEVGNMPRRWRNRALQEAWGNIQSRLKTEMWPTLKEWFVGQVREVEGVNYVPCDLLSGAVLGGDVLPNSMRWDFGHCAEYWRPSLGCYLLPPVKNQTLCGTWSGHIRYDLTPADQRYVGPVGGYED